MAGLRPEMIWFCIMTCGQQPLLGFCGVKLSDHPTHLIIRPGFRLKFKTLRDAPGWQSFSSIHG
jgi:hypothetical protein